MIQSQSQPSPTLAALEQYSQVRRQTEALASTLSDADATAQSMEDASPAKWHLAHTSWFFETFILVAVHGESVRFHPRYNYLFNQRGLLTRPSLEDIMAYRSHVDAHMIELVEQEHDLIAELLPLGLAHEQQHQELLLTDILHLFAQNPLKPALKPEPNFSTASLAAADLTWSRYDGGLIRIGHNEGSFSFDCETPHHEALVRPFELANRAVTNGEWLTFMREDSYRDPSLWLSDGFAKALAEHWQAPLYWFEDGGEWHTMTLTGPKRVNLQAPVSHISYYEADAYAAWAGARLPTEQEWEHAASTEDLTGTFASADYLQPQVQSDLNKKYFFGDVWEWTASPFMPYPGFKAAKGAVGEYNGKFMSGQMVLRGGSCATPDDHIRPTYRNFFPPEKRWQFSGLRLAKDVA